MSNYNESEIDDILYGPVFKFAKLIEKMPEEVILMGPSSIFSWFKKNIKDPTLMASLEQIIKENQPIEVPKNVFTEKEFDELLNSVNISFLHAIEKMPESVILEGTDSILNWLGNNIVDTELLNAVKAAKDLKANGYTPNNNFWDDEVSTIGIVDCGIASGKLILEYGFAPLKILEIKKAVKVLGGVNQVVKKTKSYYDINRKVWCLDVSDSWVKAINLTVKTLPSDLKKY